MLGSDGGKSRVSARKSLRVHSKGCGTDATAWRGYVRGETGRSEFQGDGIDSGAKAHPKTPLSRTDECWGWPGKHQDGTNPD